MTFLKTIALLLFVAGAWRVAAKEITVNVKGMVCGFCAQGIEKKFKKLPEVDSLKISIENKTVTIKTKDRKDVSDAQIGEVLDDAGYTVEKIQRTGS